MKKKLLSILLCIAMLSGVLTGCGENKAENAEKIDEQNVTEVETDE